MEAPKSDYTIFVKALLAKGCEKFDLSCFSERQRNDIEEAARTFFLRSQILEAIQTYYMLRNFSELAKIGDSCLKANKNEFAFYAFKYSENKEGLSKTGSAFLANGEVAKAHEAFKLADDVQMLEFIEKNFDKKF